MASANTNANMNAKDHSQAQTSGTPTLPPVSQHENNTGRPARLASVKNKSKSTPNTPLAAVENSDNAIVLFGCTNQTTPGSVRGNRYSYKRNSIGVPRSTGSNAKSHKGRSDFSFTASGRYHTQSQQLTPLRPNHLHQEYINRSCQQIETTVNSGNNAIVNQITANKMWNNCNNSSHPGSPDVFSTPTTELLTFHQGAVSNAINRLAEQFSSPDLKGTSAAVNAESNNASAQEYCDEVLKARTVTSECGMHNDYSEDKSKRCGGGDVSPMQTEPTTRLPSLSTLTTQSAATDSTTSMPTLIVTTTSAATTSMHTAIQSMSSAITSTTTTVVIDDSKPSGTNVEKNGDTKRKQHYSEKLDKAPKRRNVETNTVATQQSAEELMLKLLEEMSEVKQTVKSIQEDNHSWKTQMQHLNTEVNDLKDSVEMAHNLINDEAAERVISINKLKADVNEKLSQVDRNLKTYQAHSAKISGLEGSIQTLRMRIDEQDQNQIELKMPLENLKRDVEETLGGVNFPVKRTIVAQHVWCRENEDIEEVASAIIHKALGLKDLKIVAAMRKSGKPGGDGLIKIEMESNEAVKTVLKNKRKLRDVAVREIREVFLRQSKPEGTLVAERNEDVILREMGVRDDYIRLPSGHLVLKSDNRGGQRRDSRDNYRRGQGNRYRSSKAGYHRRGPATGSEDDRDDRVAQQERRREMQNQRDNKDTSCEDTTIENFMK